VASGVDEVLRRCPLVSFATTAVEPHVADLSICPPGAVILHVSLRDLGPQAILAADNVVDDPDHVCRAQTSIHLAEQLTGSRAHIRCTLADIYQGKAAPRRDARSIVVFSPFGLGILDLAVGKLVRDLAQAQGTSTLVPAFHPLPASGWNEAG
jgi:ornithine cyclodeaminase